jgi:thioredoxin-dependent peroxiredoxin
MLSVPLLASFSSEKRFLKEAKTMSDVTIGQIAPDFQLPSAEDMIVSLASLKGKSIILYFYPKADTSGCTKQAIAFSQLHKEFEAENAIVVGVSKDKITEHKKFRVKYNLQILLLSDFENVLSESYGVWVEKSMYGKKYMGVERSTFIIDAQGVIAHIWRKVKVEGHVDEVLRVVRKLVGRV